MARCGCSNNCTCKVQAGQGPVSVTGNGSANQPYTVNVFPPDAPPINCEDVRDCFGQFQVQDTATVNMTIEGTGIPTNPYVLRADAVNADAQRTTAIYYPDRNTADSYDLTVDDITVLSLLPGDFSGLSLVPFGDSLICTVSAVVRAQGGGLMGVAVRTAGTTGFIDYSEAVLTYISTGIIPAADGRFSAVTVVIPVPLIDSEGDPIYPGPIEIYPVICGNVGEVLANVGPVPSEGGLPGRGPVTLVIQQS